MLESRTVRNALEHFDERLDRYFEAGHRVVVDRNIGPKNRLVAIGDRHPLHAIDDVSNRVHGWLTEHGQ